MCGEFQVISDMSHLEDKYLLMELQKSKDNMNKTKEFLAGVETKKLQDDYERIKIAQLAFHFAYEKYNSLESEAKKRGLQI